MSVSERAHGFTTMSSALPEAVNYHHWIMDLLRPCLTGEVLEVGFGYGQYTRQIAPLVDRLLAVDLDRSCLRIQDSLPEHVQLKIADLNAEDFCETIVEGSYHTTVCLNVLEHIEDEQRALRNLWRSLRPNGCLLLLVPAHPALYGPMDRLAGHFRRYTRVRLAISLGQAGFQVRTLRYINPLGGMGWWLNARLLRPQGLSDPAINRQVLWFDRYVQPLSRLATPLFSRVFGQSLWAVGEKAGGV